MGRREKLIVVECLTAMVLDATAATIVEKDLDVGSKRADEDVADVTENDNHDCQKKNDGKRNCHFEKRRYIHVV